MKTSVAIMDFGTSKIVCLVAELNNKQRCDIAGAGIAVYDGYLDGSWNAPYEVGDAIQRALKEAENQSHQRIREVYVGVPAAFSRVMTVETRLSIQGADPKVSRKDINMIIDQAEREMGEHKGKVIHRSPAWFQVDEGKKTMEPTGVRGKELKALVSFVIADDFFLSDVTERFKALDIDVNGFFSTPAGEANLFVSGEERDRKAVLVDIGYLNTEVMTLEGDALTTMKVIPIGGGNIAADLAYGLEIPLSSAETVKRAYTFNISGTQNEFEVAGKDGNTRTFTREQVEEILLPRAEEICEKIREAIDDSGVVFGKWSAVFLTGGGMVINRGGRDYVCTKLGMIVRELPRKTVKMSSPVYTSTLGLLDLAIDMVKGNDAGRGIAGFFRSLFG